MVRYELPGNWCHFNKAEVLSALIDAKAAIRVLLILPFQRNWVENLQQMQLKREVAGTSRIEGADFSERELELAVQPSLAPQELFTRSQRQAHAAMKTYRWIQALPKDRPINQQLILEVHRLLVRDCDDDHCPPGVLRGRDYNVTFGLPPHRGVEGGPDCELALNALLSAFQTQYQAEDQLIQAFALHYHLAAMHPFLDGNGRTARAMEALILGRAGLTDRAFIAMSNYYYDEKPEFLRVLASTRAAGHDLTAFLVFALRGVRRQAELLTTDIRTEMQKALFRDTMYQLFNRLKSQRKRVIQQRQIAILKQLLENGAMPGMELYERTKLDYLNVKGGVTAFIRDLSQLFDLKAIHLNWETYQEPVSVNLNWPQEIDEDEFLRLVKTMPKARAFKFLS